MLGLPYPGGLPIDQLAQKGDPKAIRFPRALPQERRARLVVLRPEDLGAPPRRRRTACPQGQALADLCASFQEAVADSLTEEGRSPRRGSCGSRTAGALRRGGGELAAARAGAGAGATTAGLKLYLPAPKLCTDNGAMIAVAGYEAFRRGVRSDLGLNADPAWRL